MTVDTMSVDPQSDAVAESDYLQYRALSSAAVASVVLGTLSALAFLSWIWLCIPLAGILLGVYAWRQVSRNQRELTGLALARIGLGLSILFLFSGAGWLTYVHVTEVPEGYERISYAELQPGIGKRADSVPPAALALDGKKVFIKGYVYPGAEKEGIKQFLLVRDKGDCCFGGNPKVTERILVTLAGSRRLTFSPRLHKLAGTFRVQPGESETGGVFYQLEADHLQ